MGIVVNKIEGSPPPTRGTLIKLAVLTNFFRITPAYAGNTGKTVDVKSGT